MAIDQRFTLKPGHWYAAEIIGDEFGPALRHYSPIRLQALKPTKNGTRTFQLSFYHANYPEGGRDKTYPLRTLERANHFLFAECLDHHPRRFLLLREISWEWLRDHFGIEPPRRSQDIAIWLDDRM
jgi:hypothetical protein